jgi:hypothetical protein
VIFYDLIWGCFEPERIFAGVIPLTINICKQVVEGFEFVRLHLQYGDANGAKGQESVRALGATLP